MGKALSVVMTNVGALNGLFKEFVSIGKDYDKAKSLKEKDTAKKLRNNFVEKKEDIKNCSSAIMTSFDALEIHELRAVKNRLGSMDVSYTKSFELVGPSNKRRRIEFTTLSVAVKAIGKISSRLEKKMSH